LFEEEAVSIVGFFEREENVQHNCIEREKKELVE
jgi:hypothetical protein